MTNKDDKPAGDAEAQTDLVEEVTAESTEADNGGPEKENTEASAGSPSPDPLDPPGDTEGGGDSPVDPVDPNEPAEETDPEETDPPDETDPDPDPELPIAAETEFRSKKTGKLLTGAALSTAKKKADKVRREAAIAEAQANQTGPTDKQLAVQERKDDIFAELDEIDLESKELEAKVQELRDRSSALLLELYPQQGQNDPHHKAVRGYLKAAKNERQNRSLAPARLKALLQAAGRAPIDAAFARAKGRGMARPKRNPPPATEKQGDKSGAGA